MNTSIIKEFENITSLKITDYFASYADFMKEEYSEVEDYFSGVIENVSSNAMYHLSNLIKNGSNVLLQFQIFSNKMQKCGFWELNEYCQNLYDTLEKITKLPKYKRTVKSKSGGYNNTTIMKGEIGGMKTVEDLANEVGSNGIDEVSLILGNDLKEEDWEIDELKKIDKFINNATDIIVTTILEQPIGEKIYGKDINKKISFINNDLLLVEYFDNIKQKCEILLKLNKGDVPEFPEFGMTGIEGVNSGNYNYAELLKELNANFMSNDIFKFVSIDSVNVKDGGSIEISVFIKTKYSYSQTSKIVL